MADQNREMQKANGRHFERYRDLETTDDAMAPQVSDLVAGEANRDIENGPLTRSTSLPASSLDQNSRHRYLPDIVLRALRATLLWIKGPVPPRPWSIVPILPKIQNAPRNLLDRHIRTWKGKVLLLIVFYFFWILCFAALLHNSAFSDQVPDFGSPSVISCTSTFWSRKNGCGINGVDCRPFNDTSFAFRCPASCIKTQVLNPHAVGNQEIVYQPLVIGGPTDVQRSIDTAFYRGDSFICASAIHAGFITNDAGGCGALSLVGDGVDYPAVTQHDISSTSFDSNFPLTFKFLPGTQGKCRDLRWPILAVDVAFSAILAIFTDSPLVFFGTIFPALFFHTALVSDPPNGSSYYALVSIALGRFLPAAFIAFVFYRYVVIKSLTGLQAPMEKALLWLGPCWVGCLNNYTFDRIPIQRLTPKDIQQQPGAVAALIIIVLVILLIALGQAWALRLAGMMPRYLALYGFMVFCLVMLVAIPNMNLRIHHYILALLFLPGTAMQNRPSLIYQGLLVGLFINGIARWGFAPILQTPADLLNDGQIGTILPNVTVASMFESNITFEWDGIPSGFDTMSILVNDVERERLYYNKTRQFSWIRDIDDHPEYFRFAYMSGSSTGDYTKAGVWAANGTWMPMDPGPSVP